MSIPSHPFKRRRLDNSSSGLSKPFKSPLRASPVSQDVNVEAVASSNNQITRQNNQAAITPSRHLTPEVNSISKSAIQPPPSRANLQKDTHELTLQKYHSALLLQLTKLRQSLDTAQQALKMTTSTRDTELESLIAKWKLASREAAEEVFQGAQERVNRMGGVDAWREQSRKDAKSWGDDEREGSMGQLSEEQREVRQIQMDDLEAERKKYGTTEGEVEAEEVVERDDNSFTMDKMLQSLNIELDTIGYDKENERWCD